MALQRAAQDKITAQIPAAGGLAPPGSLTGCRCHAPRSASTARMPNRLARSAALVALTRSPTW